MTPGPEDDGSAPEAARGIDPGTARGVLGFPQPAQVNMAIWLRTRSRSGSSLAFIGLLLRCWALRSCRCGPLARLVSFVLLAVSCRRSARGPGTMLSPCAPSSLSTPLRCQTAYIALRRSARRRPLSLFFQPSTASARVHSFTRKAASLRRSLFPPPFPLFLETRSAIVHRTRIAQLPHTHSFCKPHPIGPFP